MTALLLFILAASLGVFVGAVVGFASALVSMPLLMLFMDPAPAVVALSLLTLLMNLVVVVETRAHIDWRGVTGLIVAGVAGTLLGAWALAHLPVGTLRLIVSGVTLGCGVLFLFKPPQLPEAPAVDAGLGLLSGWLGGCIGQSGPPVVFLALARGWRKDVFRGNLMAYFFVLNVVAVAAYWRLGLITPTACLYGATAVVPAFLLSLLGIWLKNRIDEKTFRTISLVTIICVGLVGLVRR